MSDFFGLYVLHEVVRAWLPAQPPYLALECLPMERPPHFPQQLLVKQLPDLKLAIILWQELHILIELKFRLPNQITMVFLSMLVHLVLMVQYILSLALMVGSTLT